MLNDNFYSFRTRGEIRPGDLLVIEGQHIRPAQPGESVCGVAVNTVEDDDNTVLVYTRTWKTVPTERQRRMTDIQYRQVAKAHRLRELCLDNPFAIEIEENQPFRPAETDIEL